MRVLIRGGGDLASGVALRLFRTGCRVVITERAQPLAVRRGASFSEAVYESEWSVEGVQARLVESVKDAIRLDETGVVPVLVAPDISLLSGHPFDAVVDARLSKQPPETGEIVAPLVIGLGPGFTAGVNCHAAVETKRGHTLGRVYWSGSTLANSSAPEGDPRRVLRSPADGVLEAHVEIGRHVEPGQVIAEVEGQAVTCPLSGILRGLIRPGVTVSRNSKIGDVDPRDVREYCFLVSERALSVGGGVLEALLTPKYGSGTKTSATSRELPATGKR